jgi:hypothetical protein
MLKKLFLEHNISFKNIIGEPFDASNMRGEYSGLQSKIKSKTRKAFTLGVIVTYLICVYVIHATI